VRLKTDWEPALSNTLCKQIKPLYECSFLILILNISCIAKQRWTSRGRHVVKTRHGWPKSQRARFHRQTSVRRSTQSCQVHHCCARETVWETVSTYAFRRRRHNRELTSKTTHLTQRIVLLSACYIKICTNFEALFFGLIDKLYCYYCKHLRVKLST